MALVFYLNLLGDSPLPQVSLLSQARIVVFFVATTNLTAWRILQNSKPTVDAVNQVPQMHLTDERANGISRPYGF